MSVDRTKASRQDLRVLKKDMIYCSGLPSILSEDELRSKSYFGQYGQIQKVVVTPYPNRNYCSVYITFSHQFEAALAILACNQFEVERSTLWCLFGTMKYCRFFLKKAECKNLPNCQYLHALDKKNEIQIKNSPSEAYPLHEKLAREVIKKHPEKVRKLKELKKTNSNLPSPLSYLAEVREKEIGKTIKKNEVETPSFQKKISEKEQKTQQKNRSNNGNNRFNMQCCVKTLLLRQIKSSKGSRVLNDVATQETRIKDIIISKLKE